MTESKIEAVNSEINNVEEASKNHLKVCLSRLRNLGVVGIIATIDIEGKKYRVSMEPLCEGETDKAPSTVQPNLGESVAGSEAEAAAAPPVSPSEVERISVPVGEQQAEATVSETGSNSAGTSEPLSDKSADGTPDRA